MTEVVNQPVSPSAELPPIPPQPEPVGTVVPVTPVPKRGMGWMWIVLVIIVAALGGGAYYFYSQQQKPVAEVSGTALPDITAQGNTKPNKGFDTSPVLTASPTATPPATPTLTASDSVSDIQKDISGTTLQAEDQTQFNADLQSL